MLYIFILQATKILGSKLISGNCISYYPPSHDTFLKCYIKNIKKSDKLSHWIYKSGIPFKF